MDIEQLKRGLLQKLQQVGQSFAQKPQQRQPIQPQDNIVSQIGRSPVGQVITNFQRGIEQRTLPKVNLQQYTNGIQNPTLHVVANFGASIGEDLANIPQRLLEGGGRIGTQVVRPLQEGRRVNPNQAVGAFASAISPIVDIATLGGGVGVKQIGKQAIKEAGKESAKIALLKGVMTGAGYGATIGGLRGLSEGNQADYVKGVQGATQGAVFGGIVGGGTAITSQLFGKIKNAFVKSGVPEKEATKEATDYITNRLLRNKRNGQFMSVGKETPMIGGGTFENPSKIKIKRWDAVDKELGIPSNLEEGKLNLSAFLGKGEDVAQPGTTKSQKLSQPLRGPMGEQIPTPEQILAKAEQDIKGATENIGGISSKESVSQVSNRMDTNTPNLQRSSELTTQSQQIPETGLGGTKSPSSLGGSGSSERSIAQVPNSENPYFNTNKLNVSSEAKQKVNEVIQEVRPQIEKIVGKKLSNKEVIATANNSSKILHKAADREATKDFTARLLRTRQQLAAAAESGTVTKEYIDNLIAVKSHASDIGRKLQAFNIGADPKLVTSKDAILDAVLKVEQDSNKVIKAAKGVDFNDLKQATDFYRKFVKPTWREKMDLIRYNSMLSSPNTHINNAFSNLGNSLVVAPIEKTLTGTLDFLNPVRRIKGNPQTQFASEGGAYTKGYVTSLNKAAHAFANSMRGKTITGNLDVRQIPLSTSKRVQMLNLPTRLLEASDQFFTTLTKGGEEAALNLRKARGIKVGNIETQALDKAKYRLFRSELHTENQGHVLNSIDDFTVLVQKARNSDNVITSTIAKFTLPFVQTPMNILKQGVEYSPAGFSTMLGAQNKTEQLSKALMGTTAAIGAGMLIASGRTTWTEPTDPKKKSAFRAAGMQPYAIKVGDKWVSYAKLPPAVGFPLAFLSSVYDAQANKKITDGQANTILSAAAKFGNFFADQSYVKNIGDLVASAKGSPESMVRFVSNYPQQVVPYRALLGWMARITDPYQRQVNTDAGFLEKQVQQLFTQIPGLSMTVPARLGPDGNPIPNQNGALNAFSPIRMTNENPDKKQYYDMLQQRTKNTRDINALKDAAAKGQDISGMIGQVGAEGQQTANPMVGYKAKFEEDMVKQKIKLQGGSTFYNNKIIYSTGSNSAGELDLNPPTKGTGIDAFVNSDWNITTARKVWNNQKISPQDKQKAWEILGVDPKDVRYDALANHNTDVSTQYLLSKSPNHEVLLHNILTGRKESISGKQFASNGVIDNLVEQGQLSKEEGKQLKALKFDKNGQSIGKSTSSTKKGKKAPKLKVKKANFKIPTKQSNAKTIKSGKPTIIKAPKVSFATQFSKNGAVPKARKYQVKFNV